MENILREIQDERIKQKTKWGEQNHNLVEWIAILTEEVGEAAKEAVDHHFKNPAKDMNGKMYKVSEFEQMDRLSDYRKELIQVAAVAVQMIECLDRNGA